MIPALLLPLLPPLLPLLPLLLLMLPWTGAVMSAEGFGVVAAAML